LICEDLKVFPEHGYPDIVTRAMKLLNEQERKENRPLRDSLNGSFTNKANHSISTFPTLSHGKYIFLDLESYIIRAELAIRVQ